MEKKRSQPYIVMLGAMFIFGTIGIFRRFAPISSALLACARGVIGTAFLCAFVKIKRGKIITSIDKRNLVLLIISGAAVGFNWMFLFEAYNRTTVAIATLCYYMAPTMVIFLSPIFLKEKLTIKKAICAVISIFGIALVSRIADSDGIKQGDVSGMLFGLAAATFYSIIVILNKKIKVEDSYSNTIIQLISATIALVPYLLITENFNNIQITKIAYIMIFVMGIVHTGIAYLMYFSSIKNLKGQSTAVLSYIDPVSALVLSSVFLSEKMSIFGIIGAVLVIGAALVSELNIKKRTT